MSTVFKKVARAILGYYNICRYHPSRLFSISYADVPIHLKNRLDLYCENKLKEYNILMASINENPSNKILIEKYNTIKSLIEIVSDIELFKIDEEVLCTLFKESEDESEYLELFNLEKQERFIMKDNLYNKLIQSLTSENDLNNISDVSFEILSGAGGQESMLFAEELSIAYLKFFAKQNFIFDQEHSCVGESGGIRSCKYLVSGQDVYSNLKYESGIHRVQRVPLTSPMGKIHTSTVAVVVLPWIRDCEIEVPEHELKWETFKSSGPGGQHVNTTDSAVRVTHVPSGVSVSCQTSRLQQSNKKEALSQLIKILNEKHFEEKLLKINRNRRVLIGSRARSDKIRTYNYQQDRITDHRIHRSWTNLIQIMGQGNFEGIISSLREVDMLDQLEVVLDNAVNGGEHH